VGLFGRHRVTPATPLIAGPVPATPAERVAAVKALLLARGLGGAAAQGRPITVDDVLPQVVAAVRHFVPDADERRALCHQMAADLQSMIAVDAVDVGEVEDVLGVTPTRLAGNGVPRRSWAACHALAQDVTRLAGSVGLGEGEDLDRWRSDDTYVIEMLAVLFVVFTRLSV
jgi:hypothetical protein